jgi:hypothetical protein
VVIMTMDPVKCNKCDYCIRSPLVNSLGIRRQGAIMAWLPYS